MRIRGMQPGDPTNWRQALGKGIQMQREARGRTLREVSRRAKVSIADVESWERGATVPNSEQWKALCQGISRSLHAFTETWQRAKAEADRERETITRSIEVHANGTSTKNNPTAPITTKLGDKLAGAGVNVKPGALLPPIVTTGASTPDARTVNPGQAVTYHAAPEAKPDAPRPDLATVQLGLSDERRNASGRRMPPPVPVGSKTARSINDRIRYARELLIARPNARTNGNDSIVEAIRHRFGIGLDPRTINELREEVRGAPKAAHERTAEPKPSTFEGVSTEKALAFVESTPPPLAPGVTSEDEIAAAVQLILDAIPNLQTFTIDVDENGCASVDYQVRKVVVTTHSGSLKVTRK